MTELRDILHERHTEMARSLRDAAEFDESTAARGVRTRRRVRAGVQSLAGVAGAAVIGIGAWALMGADAAPILPAGPTPSATPSVTPSAVVAITAPTAPTPEPTASSSPPVTISYEGRNPDMSDAEALYRAAHPATGEVWLDEPIEVEAPVSGEWQDSGMTWYRVGERHGAVIFSLDQAVFVGWTLFELAPDGTFTLVAAPRPSDPLVEPSSTHLQLAYYDDLPLSDVYYDSLALPATWTSPEGLRLTLRGGWAAHPWGEATEVGRVGNARIDRLETSTLGVEPPAGVSATTLGYTLVDPNGQRFTLVDADPLGTAASAVTFDDGTPARSDVGYIELSDGSCASTPEWTTYVEGTPAAWWTEVGATSRGTVFAPTAANELARATYDEWMYGKADAEDWYAEHLTELDLGPLYDVFGDTAPSFEDYLGLPALLAAPAPAGDGWFVEIASSLSVRMGC